MSKNPFDMPTDRALRAVLEDPVAKLRKAYGANIFDEMKRQRELTVGLFNLPQFNLPTDMLATWHKLDAENQATLAPVREALEAFDKAIRPAAAHAERMRKQMEEALGMTVIDYHRQLDLIAKPLIETAEALSVQQKAIAAVGAIAADYTSEFSQIAEALGAHYRSAAEAGAFEIDGAPSILSVAEALETVEPGHPPAPNVVDALVGLLVGLLMQLGRNTKKRAAEIDLIEIVLIIIALKGLWPDYTTADRHRDDETRELVGRIEEQVKEVAATRGAEAAYVNSLPKGVVIRTGKIRAAPAHDARIANILTKGTVVAISEKCGRWRRVVFHDQLTDELTQGWIWGGSLQTFQ